MEGIMTKKEKNCQQSISEANNQSTSQSLVNLSLKQSSQSSTLYIFLVPAPSLHLTHLFVHMAYPLPVWLSVHTAVSLYKYITLFLPCSLLQFTSLLFYLLTFPICILNKLTLM